MQTVNGKLQANKYEAARLLGIESISRKQTKKLFTRMIKEGNLPEPPTKRHKRRSTKYFTPAYIADAAINLDRTDKIHEADMFHEVGILPEFRNRLASVLTHASTRPALFPQEERKPQIAPTTLPTQKRIGAFKFFVATGSTTGTPRYFVRFPERKMQATFAPRMILSKPLYHSRMEPNLVITTLTDKEREQLEEEGAQVTVPRRYEPLPYEMLDRVYRSVKSYTKNLHDVLDHIKAPAAWEYSRGKGVHLAIVDTGVCGRMNEFPDWKRSPQSWVLQAKKSKTTDSPWIDTIGHGSMTACIATATRQARGRYNGVAPDATLISCKTTTFAEDELYEIYDHLISQVENKNIERLVINNSYGYYSAQPPVFDPDEVFGTEFLNIVRTAVSKGIVVVFAAGNNHVVVGCNDPAKCDPNTIWGANSLDEVISVGTVDANNQMDRPPLLPNGFSHRDSSRGPGQFASKYPKPDCVAPTYGEVMWGCGYRTMEWWGTSGAAPQVAGLAALILSRNPLLTPMQIRDIIIKSCTSLPLSPTCAGAGLINCHRAVEEANSL